MTADKMKLQIAMARAKMGIEDIAERASMPKVTVCKVINGKSVLPATLGKVASALGVDVTELLDTTK